MIAFKCSECGKTTKIRATNIEGYTCTCGTQLKVEKPKAVVQTVKSKKTKSTKKQVNNKVTIWGVVVLFIIIIFIVKWVISIQSGY